MTSQPANTPDLNGSSSDGGATKPTAPGNGSSPSQSSSLQSVAPSTYTSPNTPTMANQLLSPETSPTQLATIPVDTQPPLTQTTDSANSPSSHPNTYHTQPTWTFTQTQPPNTTPSSHSATPSSSDTHRTTTTLSSPSGSPSQRTASISPGSSVTGSKSDFSSFPTVSADLTSKPGKGPTYTTESSGTFTTTRTRPDIVPTAARGHGGSYSTTQQHTSNLGGVGPPTTPDPTSNQGYPSTSGEPCGLSNLLCIIPPSSGTSSPPPTHRWPPALPETVSMLPHPHSLVSQTTESRADASGPAQNNTSIFSSHKPAPTTPGTTSSSPPESTHTQSGSSTGTPPTLSPTSPQPHSPTQTATTSDSNVKGGSTTYGSTTSPDAPTRSTSTSIQHSPTMTPSGISTEPNLTTTSLTDLRAPTAATSRMSDFSKSFTPTPERKFLPSSQVSSDAHSGKSSTTTSPSDSPPTLAQPPTTTPPVQPSSSISSSEPTTLPSGSRSNVTLIGATVGGVLGLILLCIAICFVLRRRRRRSTRDRDATVPLSLGHKQSVTQFMFYNQSDDTQGETGHNVAYSDAVIPYVSTQLSNKHQAAPERRSPFEPELSHGHTSHESSESVPAVLISESSSALMPPYAVASGGEENDEAYSTAYYTNPSTLLSHIASARAPSSASVFYSAQQGTSSAVGTFYATPRASTDSMSTLQPTTQVQPDMSTVSLGVVPVTAATLAIHGAENPFDANDEENDAWVGDSEPALQVKTVLEQERDCPLAVSTGNTSPTSSDSCSISSTSRNPNYSCLKALKAQGQAPSSWGQRNMTIHHSSSRLSTASSNVEAPDSESQCGIAL